VQFENQEAQLGAAQFRASEWLRCSRVQESAVGSRGAGGNALGELELFGKEGDWSETFWL
jgi:hypothetical protein